MAQRNQLRLLRLGNENDAFDLRPGLNDKEYTNGVNLDLFYTKQTKPRFLSALLIPIGKRSALDSSGATTNLYSVGLRHFIFTPSNIFQREVIRTSRPYTAILYATHGLISHDSVRRQRLTTELSVGVLGKAALGKEIQTWYHDQLGFKQPEGWANQLPTDVVINYMIQYEKLLLRPTSYLEFTGVLSGNVGTLHNNVNAGFLVRVGIFDDYFSNSSRRSSFLARQRNVQCYVFARPMGRLVLTDAILQGGVFSGDGARHTIDRDSVKWGFGHAEYGVALTKKRFGISISQRLISRQYTGGQSHQVGNLTLFFGLSK